MTCERSLNAVWLCLFTSSAFYRALMTIIRTGSSDRAFGTPASRSWGIAFKSRPGSRVYWLRNFSLFFPAPPAKCWDNTLN